MNTFIQNFMMAATLLLTIIIPSAGLAYLSKRKRKAALLAALESTANKNGLALSHVDFLDGKVIAWDQFKKILLFTYITNDRPMLIDLSPISRCYVVRKSNGKNTTAITLQIADVNNRVRHSIPFYEQFTDCEANLKKLDGYSREWEHRINANLNQVESSN